MLLLQEGGREASSQTSRKTSDQGTCLGRDKQTRGNSSVHLWRNHGSSAILWDSSKNTPSIPTGKISTTHYHCFMQDNDPKHTSHAAQEFYTKSGINWWRTPAESPDMNPIENLWHELKEYIRWEVKPRNKQELVNGITLFWATIDVHKCCQYIDHLKKVLPKVIEKGGAATGY